MICPGDIDEENLNRRRRRRRRSGGEGDSLDEMSGDGNEDYDDEMSEGNDKDDTKGSRIPTGMHSVCVFVGMCVFVFVCVGVKQITQRGSKFSLLRSLPRFTKVVTLQTHVCFVFQSPSNNDQCACYKLGRNKFDV